MSNMPPHTVIKSRKKIENRYKKFFAEIENIVYNVFKIDPGKEKK